MNANELADIFGTTDMQGDWGCKAQEMLRQQAARIADLEEEVLKYERHIAIRALIELNGVQYEKA